MSVTLHRSFPVANKVHRCGSCGGPIAAAEQYHRWKGTTDVAPTMPTARDTHLAWCPIARALAIIGAAAFREEDGK